MAEIEALDLSALVVYLAQHLPSDMQGGEHEQPDVELHRRGEEGSEVVLVIVLLVRVPAEVLAVVSDGLAEFFGLVDLLAAETA